MIICPMSSYLGTGGEVDDLIARSLEISLDE